MTPIQFQKWLDAALFAGKIAVLFGLLAFLAAAHPSRGAITPPPPPEFVIVEPDLPTPEEREAAKKKAAARKRLNAALNATIADTRTNIVETADMTDEQIAGLYLQQMKRDVSPLVGRVPTNTVEFLIGAGMRMDIAGGDVPESEPAAPETEAAE